MRSLSATAARALLPAPSALAHPYGGAPPLGWASAVGAVNRARAAVAIRVRMG